MGVPVRQPYYSRGFPRPQGRRRPRPSTKDFLNFSKKDHLTIAMGILFDPSIIAALPSNAKSANFKPMRF